MPDEIRLHPETTLIISRCRVAGGKSSYTEQIRDETEDQTRTVETRTVEVIENVEERKRAEALRSEAAHIVRKACANTLIGQLCPRGRVAEINAGLAEVKARAELFNDSASSCQVEIGILPIEIAIALGPEAARAIADHVRDELSALRRALLAGDVAQARAILLPGRAGNLAQLAVGVQADSIRFAIEEGIERLAELRKAIRGDGTISKTAYTAGLELSGRIEMIEAAIGMFTYGAGDQLSLPPA